MEFAFLSYLVAFIEGFALILSPCILPILPIVLSASITGDKQRSLGIICGFVITFSLFTLFSHAIVEHLGLNLDWVRQISYILIILFGIILFSDYLSEKFSAATQRLANINPSFGNYNQGSFLGGLLLGLFISLIWVPCGGPILAAAIVQVAIQKTYLQSFFAFFFFALGSVIPMLLLAFAGKQLIDRILILKTHTHTLRKVFALIIIIAAAGAAFFGPAAGFAPMPAAPNVVIPNQSTTTDFPSTIVNGLKNTYLAPPINSQSDWINSPPLSLEQLRGKVVLIDFWTYSCINCVRTLPYLNDWYAKYHKDGLVIIGVHSPEFEFEKNLENVKQAVAKYNIHYPVVMDSDYQTWLNYHNHYWPADYLIDKQGNVVYAHFGEGDYAEAEHNIRVLLGLSSEVEKPTENIPLLMSAQTPETYLGYARADSFYNPARAVHDATSTYHFPHDFLPRDAWSLDGEWMIQAEKIVATSPSAALKIHFYASKVYVVAGSTGNQPALLKVLLDGKPIGSQSGKDVTNGMLSVSNHTLYEVVSLPAVSDGVLELIPESPGVEFYTFTFGS